MPAPVEVVETPPFMRRAETLFSTAEVRDLIDHLARHPLDGDEIPGTGGVRKMRFAAQGRGKSGGVRVIYYYYDQETPLYALVIYAKGERANLSPQDRKTVAAFARAIKTLACAKRGD